MSTDLVSVIIPCFNSCTFVEEAISSAYEQIHQPIEVIVIDDGSTDGSWELLHELQHSSFPDLIVLCHPGRVNLGVSSTRALGARQSRGKYLAFLDADDIFLPNKLSAQINAMSRHPEVVLCHTAVVINGDQSDFFSSVFNHGPTPDPYQFRHQKDYLIRHGICNSSVLIRAEALQRQPFAIRQRYQYEDWLCWCLLAAEGPFLFLPEALLIYRVHTASATALMVRSRLDQLFAMVEFKLALLARSKSSFHALRVLFSAGETLRQLIVEYLWDPSSPPPETTRQPRPNGIVCLLLALGKGARLLRRRASAH